ncbi:hypothetical protein QEJ31_10735 [Pigmentibacter sp. JX0631]|uniref:hypothetical protein n=1 Tax=Pigmentibacter sp. JX0631 TaxID=2976982 RepID=UPI002468BD2B|nr:hypothetical protein [Pigmentibacter sp. JX0631]WGL58995.1 hypothetical protein QEJ31_10735 [Pigmentibacter sp. JX0631]
MKNLKYVFFFVCIFLFQSIHAQNFRSKEEIFSQYFKPTIDCTWLKKCSFRPHKKETTTKFRFVL